MEQENKSPQHHRPGLFPVKGYHDDSDDVSLLKALVQMSHVSFISHLNVLKLKAVVDYYEGAFCVGDEQFRR